MNTSVGQLLREARELKDLTLQDAARATHIRLQYLQELENDHPELLPSRAQARGFLRLYAEYLNLDSKMLLEMWEPKQPEETSIPERESESRSTVETPVVDETHPIEKETQKKKLKLPAFKLPRIGKKKAQEEKTPAESDEETLKKLKKKKERRSQMELEKTPARDSKEAFVEVGEQMRSRREKMGLTLADAEQFTRLRRMYIQAIEDGRLEDLPSTVQGRGMVMNYARFLEMDQDAVLNTYTEGLESQRQENLEQKWSKPEPAIRVSVRLPDKLRRFLSPDLIFGALVVVALFAFIFWGASQIFGNDGMEEPTEAPSISEMLQSTQTPTLEMAAEETEVVDETPLADAAVAATEVVEQVPTPIATANTAPLQLYIVAQQRAWMQVTVDGEVEFEGRIVPGNAYTFSGDDRIQLVTGNGSALEVYFNQEYLGKLGEIGEVINLDFTLEGLSIPEPTITPTPTLTPTPTATPEATEEIEETP